MIDFDALPQPPPEVNRHQQALGFDAYVMSSGLGSRLTSHEDRMSFIAQLDNNQFLDLLFTINGNLTDQPPSAQLVVEHMNTLLDPDEAIVADVTPAPEDKLRLLRSTLAAAHLSPVDAYKPLTLATGLLAVHPFAAGNGRTARALYLLFSQDYTPGDTRLYDALQDDGVDVVPFDMRLLGEAMYEQVRLKSGTHEPNQVNGRLFPKVIPTIVDRQQNIIEYTPRHREPNFLTEASLFGLMVSDRYLGEMIPAMLTQRRPVSSAVRQSTATRDGQTWFAVDRFLLNATAADVEQVTDIYKKLTRQYVQTLVRTMAGIDNQHLGRQIFVNEGDGVRRGQLATLMYELAERIVTPDLARNQALARQLGQTTTRRS